MRGERRKREIYTCGLETAHDMVVEKNNDAAEKKEFDVGEDVFSF